MEEDEPYSDSEGDDYLEYGEEDMGIDSDDEESDGTYLQQQQESYTILDESEIEQRQEDAISEVSALISTTAPDSTLLLRHYNWDVAKLQDQWFADESAVRKAVGLPDPFSLPAATTKLRSTCKICLDDRPLDVAAAAFAACGHPFCTECWRSYIGISVRDGPGCLNLRCPMPSCRAAIGPDMVETLVAAEDWERYRRYLLRSYVEDNGRKRRWCPAPGCDCAVEYAAGGAVTDIVCRCSHSFCWHCAEEPHRPVGCETVAKWLLKNRSEAENVTWILANSKACPKCRRPIEKNHGCMHMTCSAPCRFEFCWLCLGPWAEHGGSTGGFYACNKYEKAKSEGLVDEGERKREMAKAVIEKYTFYYERWSGNQKAYEKAAAELEEWRETKGEQLRDLQCRTGSEVKFVVEAYLVIVEGRRVLKWSYAYGYYLAGEKQAQAEAERKKSLFEFLQNKMESFLEVLHGFMEKDIQYYMDPDNSPKEEEEDHKRESAKDGHLSFDDFKRKVANMTTTTKTYIDNLVRGLENGLPEMG